MLHYPFQNEELAKVDQAEWKKASASMHAVLKTAASQCVKNKTMKDRTAAMYHMSGNMLHCTKNTSMTINDFYGNTTVPVKLDIAKNITLFLVLFCLQSQKWKSDLVFWMTKYKRGNSVFYETLQTSRTTLITKRCGGL